MLPPGAILELKIHQNAFADPRTPLGELTVFPDPSTVSLLLELLSVKFGYFSISCLSKDDVAYAIDLLYLHLLIVVN